MPYPGEAESVQGFVMNFSTGEIIDNFIPLRKVEYCTECLLHTIIYIRTLGTFYFSNFHKKLENCLLLEIRCFIM